MFEIISQSMAWTTAEARLAAHGGERRLPATSTIPKFLSAKRICLVDLHTSHLGRCLIRVKGTCRAGKAGPCHKKKIVVSQHASSAVDSRHDQRVCVGTKHTIYPRKSLRTYFTGCLLPWIYLIIIIIIIKQEAKEARDPENPYRAYPLPRQQEPKH
jgi:hypothetical protein